MVAKPVCKLRNPEKPDWFAKWQGILSISVDLGAMRYLGSCRAAANGRKTRNPTLLAQPFGMLPFANRIASP
jgi:hypothetical protein